MQARQRDLAQEAQRSRSTTDPRAADLFRDYQHQQQLVDAALDRFGREKPEDVAGRRLVRSAQVDILDAYE